MAISPQAFPPRKRRPSVRAFISPKLSEQNLLQSLLLLSKEISSLKSLQFLLKQNSLSLIRKAKLLTILFEELLQGKINVFSHSALLCFEEMYIVFQRIKTLIEDCSNGSKMWLLIQNEFIAYNFNELTVELSTLLDIFPFKEIELSQDLEELACLIRKQFSETNVYVDPDDESLRHEVFTMLDRIKREIIPDQTKLSEIFIKLGICDSSSCMEEIESLQDEVQNHSEEKTKSGLIISLMGLVRYAKCVLFGASTPETDDRHQKSKLDAIIPMDFRCPISLDLIRDPVVVATGQTYDLESIKYWIESGHNTCPKTGQNLSHTELIPNRALKNLIAMWCREQKIPFETAENQETFKDLCPNNGALEATKMMASFLTNKLSQSQSLESVNGVVYELRVLAKTDSENRLCIAEAGAIVLLVQFLGSSVGSSHPNLQVNAVTTILNLSILESNKSRIVETDGAVNGIIEVLRLGTTWEAKGNAAATIFSLSSVPTNRKKLGRKKRVIKGLMELAKEGPSTSKKDALAAILNLAGERETVAKLVEGGVVEMTIGVMEEGLLEEAVTVMEAVVKRGGLLAVAAAYGGIKKLGVVMREGSERGRESAAATLVIICRKGGSDMVAELGSISGIERVIWELMGTGTVRARRKAATLLRLLRRWAISLELHPTHPSYSTTVASSATVVLTG